MIVELSQVRDLMLVNQEHPISWNPQSLVLVGGRVLMDERAASALNRLMEELDGWRFITAVSGWRSQEEQHEIYIRSLWENGEEFTKQFVARPGHSEHQTGLAIDLGLTQPNIDFLRPYFPYEGICQTFRERAASPSMDNTLSFPCTLFMLALLELLFQIPVYFIRYAHLKRTLQTLFLPGHSKAFPVLTQVSSPAVLPAGHVKDNRPLCGL